MRLTAAFFAAFLTVAAQASGPGMYIVVLDPAAGGAQALHDGDVAAAGAVIAGRDYGLLYVSASAEAAGLLAAHSGVKYVQPVGSAERPAAAPRAAAASSARRIVRDQSPPVWNSGTYHYDGAGDIYALGQIAPGDTPAGDGQLTHYTYDALIRITAVQVQDPSHPNLRNEAYQYDPYGNLTDYRFNSSGAYTHVPVSTATNHADTTFGYDVAGNVITDSSTVYARDALNMIVTAAHDGVTDINLYTADDERVARLADGAWTWSFRGIDNKVLRQYRSPAANPLAPWLWTEDYVYANGGRLLATERPAEEGGRRFFHLDHLGTPRLITGTNGQALEQHDYTAFGDEATFLTQTSMRQGTAAGFDREEPMHFTGHERDFPCGTAAETVCSVDYMHARYYSPVFGRFLSADSGAGAEALTSPQAWNRYSYVNSGPIAKVDPDGYAEKPVVAGLRTAAKLVRLAFEDRALRTVVGDGLDDLADYAESSDKIQNHILGNAILDPAALHANMVQNVLSGGKLALDIAPIGEGAGAAGAAERGGGLSSVMKGRIGEELAGIVQENKQLIDIPGTIRSRVPDELTSTQLREIKNVVNQSLTSQLRDFLSFSRQQGIEFILEVGRKTQISKPLQDLIDAGLITLRRNPLF